MWICWFFSLSVAIRWPYVASLHPSHDKIIAWQISIRSCIGPKVTTWFPLSLRASFISCFHGRYPNRLRVFLAHPHMICLLLSPLQLFFVPERSKPFVKDSQTVNHCISLILGPLRKSEDWVTILNQINSKTTYNVVRCVYRCLDVKKRVRVVRTRANDVRLLLLFLLIRK